ncbi:MAG TPA: XRE family transcriptional regulator [Flavobacteriaceae bacterium]|jgi:transcriptional regulator with XRE-family HTH domain|nr:XRE family transcriptional regulator [Flavobacteriaceae bacterium]
MNTKAKFGKKVRILRLKLGVSQEKLGELSDIDRTYISNIESGNRNPSLLTIEKLANALKINIKELFDDKNQYK